MTVPDGFYPVKQRAAETDYFMALGRDIPEDGWEWRTNVPSTVTFNSQWSHNHGELINNVPYIVRRRPISTVLVQLPNVLGRMLPDGREIRWITVYTDGSGRYGTDLDTTRSTARVGKGGFVEVLK